MVREMCGVQMMDKQNTEELMDILGLNEMLNKLSKENEVRWYRQMLRREDGNVLEEVLQCEVANKRTIE